MKPTLLASLLLSITACSTTDSVTYEAREARLTEADDDGLTDRAWYQAVEGLSYEAVRAVAASDRLHHLDVMDFRGPLALTTGTTYVDGPAVDGRGSLTDYLDEDGHVVGAPERPWIDLIACDGDFLETAANCVTAERTEVWREASGRVNYRATLPGGAIVSGSFLAAEL